MNPCMHDVLHSSEFIAWFRAQVGKSLMDFAKGMGG